MPSSLPFIGALLSAAFLVSFTGCLPEQSVEAASIMLPPPSVENGKHIVENVAMCADCHTPRNASGKFDRNQWLQGAPLPFEPTVEMPWASAAPPIAGLPTYSDEQAVTLFMTGESRLGQPLRPPMPSYRFTEQEARDVVAYLHTLAPSAGQ